MSNMAPLVVIDISAIVNAARKACGDAPLPLLNHGPNFDGNEWEYLKTCIDTAWVSSAGSFVSKFEELLQEFTGAKYAIAVVNGTSALHTALLLAGVTFGDEVLVPSLTFVATANAVTYCNATPHFCDVERVSLGIDVPRLDAYLSAIADHRNNACWNRKTGRRISAIVPMHALGHPLDMGALMELSRKWDLAVVEDAAESLGSYYHGRHTGTFGMFGVLSFNSNKIVTTGGGGAILTNDDALAQRAKHITSTAKVSHPWQLLHDEIGFNYRLPNINAALGCAQMEKLPSHLANKRRLAQRYFAAFEGVSGVKMLREPPGCSSNYWLNSLVLDQADIAKRDEVLQALNDAGLQSRAVWKPMHLLPMYTACPRMDLSATEDLATRLISMPSSSNLAASDK